MDFLRSYELLELQPGCTWEELQAMYRRQVQRWHPDRFEQHPEHQPEAARRIVEINEAFGLLAQFYREQGRLPLGYQPPEPPAPPAPPRTPKSDPVPHRRPRHGADLTTAIGLGFWLLVALLLGLAVFLSDAIWVGATDRTGDPVHAPERAVASDTAGHPEERPVPIPVSWARTPVHRRTASASATSHASDAIGLARFSTATAAAA